MNTKITLPIEEYNSLKKRINDLEIENVKLNNKLEEKNIETESLQDSMDYILNGISSLERIFQWKSVVKAVKGELNIN